MESLPRTPKGSTFPTKPPHSPGQRCAESAAQLADAFKGLSNPRDSVFLFTNVSVVKTLALVRKQVSNGFYLASRRRRAILTSNIVHLTETTEAFESLADTFDDARRNLDKWADDFDAHILGIGAIPRLLGPAVNKAIKILETDFRSLSTIVKLIIDADNFFTSQWIKILENRPDGLQAYPTVLKQSWLQDTFQMQPKFLENQLDEATIQYCDGPMDDLGREWSNDAIERSANGPPYNFWSVHKQIKDIASTLKLPLDKADLENVNLPTNTIAMWSDITRKLQMDARTMPLRMCCFGSVKHGKSSFINSLIGKIIAEPGELSTTAWPILVKHVPGNKDPVLKINSDHFSPYLSFLREAEFTTKSRDKVLNKIGSEEDMKHLKRFEDTKDPYVFKPQITSPPEVQESLIMINRLMRLCWKFCTGATFPVLKNTLFPTIEVEFACFANSDTNFEILDLPGLNERKTTMPEHIMEQALSIGVHGCILACSVEGQEMSGTTLAVTRASEATDEPPIAVYGTHAETWGTIDETKKNLAKQVWADASAQDRVALGAPGLYVSALEALAASYDERQERRPLRVIWKNTICHSAILKIIKRLPEKGGEEKFNAVTPALWKASLNDLMDLPLQKELESHFHKNAIKDGVDRRQLHFLRQARDKMQQLMAIQDDLTTRALYSLRGPNDALKNDVKFFQKKASKIFEQWDPAVNPLLDSVKDVIEAEVKVVRTEAMTEIGRVILSNVIAEHELKTPGEAKAFIHELEDSVKARLGHIVAKFVSAIRKAATDAWEGRLHTLSTMLTDIQVTIPFIQMEIAEALSADAVNVAQAIREDTMKTLSQVARGVLSHGGDKISEESLEQFAGSEWDHAFGQSWIPHQQAQAAITKTRLNLHLHPNVEIVVAAVNELGFLLRAPVSGDAKAPECSDWSVLKEPFPVTVEVAELQSHLQKTVVDPWFEVLEEESAKCLSGAITKAALVARKKVETMLDERLAELDVQQTKSCQQIDMDLVHKLVLARAQCAALHGAVDELYNSWASELSTILPKKFRPQARETRNVVGKKVVEKKKEKQIFDSLDM